jgi:hypothetical protein
MLLSSMAHLISVPDAAALTGLPLSTLRKSFMRVRPPNVPAPPPHKRIGRSVYVVADKLQGWVETLPSPEPVRKRGRPTKAEQIAKRDRNIVPLAPP